MTKLTAAQSAALVPDQSLSVIAGAGTGKTFLLGEKYLSLLAHHAGTASEIHAGNILALTYTEKAATEMKERIERAVLLRISTDPQNARFWKSISDEFFRCSISTFHGFCSSLLREFSFEAAIDPTFHVMEELDTVELVSDVVSELFRAPPAELAADVLTLYHHLNHSTILEYTCLILANWREYQAWFRRTDDPVGLIEEWMKLYEQMLSGFRDGLKSDAALARVIEALDADQKWAEVCALYRRLMRCEVSGIASLLPELASAVKNKRRPKNLDATDAEWERFTLLREELKKILAVPSPSEDSELTCATIQVLAAFSHLVSYLYGTILEKKRQRGAVDFDDLVYYASRVLENPSVLHTLQKRFRYVLVDEVQDNDPVLSRMILALCGDPKESDKLFIVGDPKQSIYGFRGADVSGIRALSDKFSRDPIVLDQSFRTVPQILSFVNGIFSRIFADPVEEWQTEYHALYPCTERSTDSGKTILLTYACSPEEKVPDEEAAMLAGYLSYAVRNEALSICDSGKGLRPVRFGDICILVEARTSLGRLLHACDQLSVPYQVHKGQSFYERQEVYDLVNLLTAVVYPETDAALYGTLRSPYFGISDEILCSALSNEGSGRNLFSRLSSSQHPAIVSALSRISAWHDAILTGSLSRVVRRIVLESGIYAVYAAMPEGPAMTANLEKLLSICRTKSELTGITPFAFVDLLQTSIERNLKEPEADFADAGDSVKIMTIHASKGLEFPVVAVAFCGAPHKRQASSMLFDPVYGVGFSLMLPTQEKPQMTFLQGYLAPLEIEKNLEERRRLLYVALTRGRDHLIICGAKKGESYGKNSFMSWIEEYRSALSPELCGVVAPERESYAPRSSDSGISSLRDRPKLPEEFVEQPLVYDAGVSEEPPKPRISASLQVTPDHEENLDAMARGSAMHEIFAGRCAEDVVRSYGLTQEEGQYFLRLRDLFFSSPLVLDATGIWFEREISCSLCGETLSARVDCLIRTPHGFTVVDFKSGSRNPGLESYYMREIALYALAINETFGSFPQAYLYYAELPDAIVPAVFSTPEEAGILISSIEILLQTEHVI